MDTVGDVIDRNILNRVVVPHILPDAPGDLAMKPADSIGVSGQSESQRSHTKVL